MSLHLGNLPPRIRIDDLERVFRRFGRCTIQVKDKYGFVVYDYPASAEKALKMLRGKRICGEAITLSWSTRQPRALRRFARGGKPYEPPRREHNVKENIDQRLNSNDRREPEMELRQANGDGRKIGLSNVVGESTSYNPGDLKDYVGERDQTSLHDPNRSAGAGRNHLENDRWEEQIVNPSNGMENVVEFDRYEPYHSDDRKESDEHRNLSPLPGSPSTRKGQGRTRTGHNGHLERSNYPYDPISQKACFACGKMGHKKRQCPRFSRSRGRLPAGGDSLSRRGHESDMEPSTSRSRQGLLKHEDSHSSPPQITSKVGRRDFTDKKRNKWDYGDLDKHHPKKARGASSSSNHSNSSSSRSRSPTRSPPLLPQSPSLSKSKSTSKSKPVPLRDSSPSSLSRSSASRHSRSETFESQSISRSTSPTSSPLLLDKQPPPSPSGKQKDYKDPGVDAVGLANNEFEREKLLLSSAINSESEHTAKENECEARTARVEVEEMEEDLCNKDDELCHSIPNSSGKEFQSYIPQSDASDQGADNLFPHTVKEIRDSQHDDVMGNHILAPQSDASLRPSASNSSLMSSEEIYMVLKHYGLQCPEENEQNLPAEVYFGSARSWPWEIIYYRRLKKGPISTENYARRIAQNEEFRIVDKYIRGSSGWGELKEDNS